MAPEILLLIEQGEPHSIGSRICFKTKEILLGRTWENSHPDLNFANLCISRRHALLTCKNNRFYLSDLGSKHGTKVNDYTLQPNKAFPLCHGDRITLAKGAATIIFNNPSELNAGETIDFMTFPPNNTEPLTKGLVIEPGSRKILLDGRITPLLGKELELLLLLYQNCNKAVSYDQIKNGVWPERMPDPVKNVPDVGNDEITALAYRLRKKLGNYGKNIVAVPRYGYMLEKIS